jgi:GDP-mannose 6-dehydrogenase
VGANKLFIEEHLPHIADLITSDPAEALLNADIVLLNHKNFDPDPYIDTLSKKDALIDLVRIPKLEAMSNYVGLCW